LTFTQTGCILAHFLLEDCDADDTILYWIPVYEYVAPWFYNEIDQTVIDDIPNITHDNKEHLKQFLDYIYEYDYNETDSSVNTDEYESDEEQYCDNVANESQENDEYSESE